MVYCVLTNTELSENKQTTSCLVNFGACYITIREGPENLAQPNIQIQTDTYKLDFTHRVCPKGHVH